MADDNVKEYINYKGDTIKVDWGKVEESKGCLEMLALLPFMGVIYYVYQILSGQ